MRTYKSTSGYIDPRKRNLHLAVILFVAVLLRVLVVVTISDEQINDFRINMTAANNLASTGNLDTLPGGYYLGPALLGGFAINLLGSTMAYYILQILVGVLTVFLFFRFTRSYFGDERIALICAWLLALYPDHILYTAIFGYEIVYLLLAFSTLHFLTTRSVRSHPFVSGAALGASIAISLFFRSYLLPLIPIMILMASILRILNLFPKHQIKFPYVLRWRYLLSSTCVFLLLFIGFTQLRISLLGHATHTTLWKFIWWGNNPVTGGELPPLIDLDALESELEPVNADLSSEGEYRNAVLDFARSRPHEFAALQLIKFQKLIRLKPDGFPVRHLTANAGMNGMVFAYASIAFFILVYLGGVASICGRAQLNSSNWGFWILGLVLVLVNITGVVSPRYRQSLIGLYLIPFAAAFLNEPRKTMRLIYTSVPRRISAFTIFGFTLISWFLDAVYLLSHNGT